MSRSRKNDYLLLRDIIVDTYLEVYKIPIKLDPGMNFQHIKNVYNYLKKATNIDMKDFVRFTMDNWIVLMSKIASTSVQQNERMKVFHIGYFAAAVESFLIMYADKKDLIGYIPGDFRHNEVVDLVRKGISKEDAEKKISAKYDVPKLEKPKVGLEELEAENAKLKEQMSSLVLLFNNTKKNLTQEVNNLTAEVKQLKGTIKKYRRGELKSGDLKIATEDTSIGDIGVTYSEGCLNLLTDWQNASEADREEIRKTRQYLTQHEMYEDHWRLVDSGKVFVEKEK